MAGRRHEPRSPRGREPSAAPPPEPEEGAPRTVGSEPRGDTVDAGDEYSVALEEAEDRRRRPLADLDDLRGRHARELGRERQAERTRVLATLLPVIDDLELALAHADADPRSIVESVRAVRDQAVEVLDRLGYPRQEETGIPFDPFAHEVVGVVDAPDTEPGTVVGVQRPGYGPPDDQLRPMAVRVSKARE